MKIIFYSAHEYDRRYFLQNNDQCKHDMHFVTEILSENTVSLIDGETAVCVFVNDMLDRNVIDKLAQVGVRLIALRCTGSNNVDCSAAKEACIKVVNVPQYSPNAVAEHTLCLMLALNRKICRAYNRVREGNFSLDGLLGFNFSGRTIGIIGTGAVGSLVARIMTAVGMNILAYDKFPNDVCRSFGVSYVNLSELIAQSDVISMHCPLTPETYHLINATVIDQMKPGVMLINTSRGGLLDTCAVIQGLKSKKIGTLGLDVYEQESELFFKDLSYEIIQDDIFERLLTLPNVIITTHQGFFTSDALINIAKVTLKNISQFEQGQRLVNEVF